MNTVANYILYFFIYSFIGWLLEVTCKFIETKKFVNRGFLLGPICPIYGYGFIFIILVVGTHNKDLLGIFLKSILVCSILEYFTSFFMEKIFKARWWDYSKKKFNINGRICLETMLPFGIMGTLVLYFIHPQIISLVGLFSHNIKFIITGFLLIIFILDNIISFKVMSKIKIQIKKQKSDNTTAVKKKVIEWIDQNSLLYRRIKNAFPKFKVIETVKKIKDVVIIKPKNNK